jgi:hypothetical protein
MSDIIPSPIISVLNLVEDVHVAGRKADAYWKEKISRARGHLPAKAEKNRREARMLSNVHFFPFDLPSKEGGFGFLFLVQIIAATNWSCS